MADLLNENLVDVYEYYEQILDYNEAAEENIRVPRRVIRDTNNPFEFYSDEEFRKRFRFRKNTAIYIIDLIKNDLQIRNNRGLPISIMFKVLIALRFFATGCFQIVCGDLLNLSQSSVCRIVKNVAISIARRRPQFIKFPNIQQIGQNSRKFLEKYGFPGVIGCIDCTHVNITSRGGQMAEIYRNRHGNFSFNVQCVTGPCLEIIDIVARWPGSAHDSRIFDNSRVRVRMENEVPRGYILLGDRGYPCRRYLLTLLINPSTAPENAYQRAHITTRNTVERVFGIWKKKFHCLSSVLAYKTHNILAIIVATAVLYNIGNQWNDNDIEEAVEDRNEYQEHENVADNAIGLAIRRAFIQRHFT